MIDASVALVVARQMSTELMEEPRNASSMTFLIYIASIISYLSGELGQSGERRISLGNRAAVSAQPYFAFSPDLKSL